MTMPNYLIIGAAKAGTTSLRTYLDQHPEVFVTARGEPSFFAHEGETLTFSGPGDEDWADSFITDLGAYQSLFDGAEGYKAVGEISPRYLYFERAPERIAHHAPDARLIAILRHPVDRAYSHFLMNRSRGCEPAETLSEAIDKEAERAVQGWGWDWRYVGAGLYHGQLERYYARFPGERIKVFLYEDLKRPDAFFSELFTFLGVDPDFRPDTSVRHRTASHPKNYALQHLVKQESAAKAIFKRLVPKDARARARKWVASWNATTPERLAPEVRHDLFERYFAEDCRRLEPMIGRSLATWFR
ncbi:sulfotransferase [Pikeienuella sp. HZG-20]|uniref:sulfotransferase family protein n=1 Tax=Paludibacillus litoralis TaxID=3133267 RepID=UPI0030EC6586